MNSLIRRLAKRTLAGFTLAELIVVITVLAILATVGFLALSGYSQDAKDSAVAANVRSLQTAISSESAITSNSPRYYVIHNTGASLSGAFVYLDGTQTTLTGGDWNAAWTNYSAGNPDYAKLKLNPEKFKTASLRGLPFVLSSRFTSAHAAYGQGFYDSKYLTVGAMESVVSSGSKPRSTTYFQVAGLSAATGKATVTGNFPTSDSVSGSVVGLIAADPSKNATGALVDGVVASVSAQIGCAPSIRTSNGHSYAVASASNGDSTVVTSSWVAVTGGTITYVQSFLCSNGTVSEYGPETANSPNCSANYANVSGACVPNSCKAIKTEYPSSADGTYLIDADGTGSMPAFNVLCDMTTDGGGWTNVNYNFGNVVALTANNGISTSGVSSAAINAGTVSLGAVACGWRPHYTTYFTDAFSGAIAFSEVLYNVKSYGISDVRCGGVLQDVPRTGLVKFTSFSDNLLGRCDNNYWPWSGYGFGGENNSSDLRFKIAKPTNKALASLVAECTSGAGTSYLKINSFMVR